MLYRVSPSGGAEALERRVQSIVDDFLELYLAGRRRRPTA
jgi:hypothetical protein